MSPERKKIFVLYDAITSIDREARNHPMVTNREEFNNYLNKLHILEALDGSIVSNFDTLQDGGQYRAVQDIDLAQPNVHLSSQALEMEAAAALETIVKDIHPTAHMHHNVQLQEHYGEDKKTFVVMLEVVKSQVHPSDIDLVLKKADDLRSEIANHSKFAFTSGYFPNLETQRFSHFKNVGTIVPCLASRHFPDYMVDACIAKNIIPLRPSLSGSRYSVGAQGGAALLKLLKHLK